jgi:hypothetical protein
MSKIFIEDTTLVAIGDAIREKTGSSDKLSPLDMPSAIGGITTGGGGGLTEWTIKAEGNGSTYSHPTTNNTLNEYLDGKSFTINTDYGVGYLFANSRDLVDLSKVKININGNSTNASYMFSQCNNLKQLPILNIADGISRATSYYFYVFDNCYHLRNIDNDFWQKIFSLNDSNTGVATYYQIYALFRNCYSLRQLPDMTVFDDILTSQNTASRVLYYQLFQGCYALDTIDYLPVINTTYNITSNMFADVFTYCYRVKDIIFATDNETPYARNWRNQYIDLRNYVGYMPSYASVINHNSGITADKEVKDDATYQALKNDSDWFSKDVAYSRYNHDSAVRTINSLPDTSAFITSSGGTNTIVFVGDAGSATDGGAINTLTEEEIAVATAKGWTVSLT